MQSTIMPPEIEILRSLVRLRSAVNTAISLIEDGITLRNRKDPLETPYHYRIREFQIHDMELEKRMNPGNEK